MKKKHSQENTKKLKNYVKYFNFSGSTVFTALKTGKNCK